MEFDFLDDFNPEPGSGFSGLLDSGADALLTSGNPYGMAAGALTKLGASMSNMFRRGAREADAIVPIQNELDLEVLRPVGTELADPMTNLERLIELRGYLKQGLDQFQAFIRDPRWSADGDNRAANQAFDTILGQPGYGQRLLEHIDLEISNRGGYVPGSTLAKAAARAAAPAESSSSLLPALAIGAAFLLKG